MTETGQLGLSRFIWESRYRDPDAETPEERIADSWNRVAIAVAAVERDAGAWRERFLAILRDKGVLRTRKDANRVYYRVGDTRTLKLLGMMRDVFCGFTK